MNPVMRSPSDEIANTIHIVVPGRDPLIRAITIIDNRPEILRLNFADNFEVFSESFETDSAPNIVELRFGVEVRFEILVKRVFVKDAVGGQVIHCLAATPAIDKFFRAMAADKNHVRNEPLWQFNGATVQRQNHALNKSILATQQFV